MSWPVHMLTLFPEMFPGPLGFSLMGRALENGVWTCNTVDIRTFAEDKHQTVDDTPFGGGAGMLMRADIVGKAIDHVYETAHPDTPLIYVSPKGEPLTQDKAKKLAEQPHGMIILCGRFEGIDERVIQHYSASEISVGDFVMTGGEMAAYCIADACLRLRPGVIGKAESLEEESFAAGLLEYPQYTRPQTWRGLDVPDVLISGHHGKIAEWRKEQAEMTTKKRRPDMWKKYIEEGRI